PTEGGLAAGLSELVAASGLGARVVSDRIRVLPETAAVCDALGLDPLNLLASGALLIAVASDADERVTAALGHAGVDVATIGEVRPDIDGLTISRNGRESRLEVKDRDETARAFEDG